MAATLPKRILKETERLAAEPVPGIDATPHSDNLRYFDVKIHGPSQSPYEGGIFKLELFLPDDYPMTPPKIRFLTKIYHPNIDKLGRICLDVLKSNWSPALQIRTILLSIQALLGAPNPDDPLANDVAQHWKEDQEAAIQTAREWTLPYITLRAAVRGINMKYQHASKVLAHHQLTMVDIACKSPLDLRFKNSFQRLSFSPLSKKTERSMGTWLSSSRLVFSCPRFEPIELGVKSSVGEKLSCAVSVTATSLNPKVLETSRRRHKPSSVQSTTREEVFVGVTFFTAGLGGQPKTTGMDNASDKSSSNGSFVELLTHFDPFIERLSSFQSSSEESSPPVESPQGSDEQSDADWDLIQTRPSLLWDPLKPTHNQAFEVPIFPRKRISLPEIIPDYLVEWQEGLEPASQKTQHVDEEIQAGLKNSLNYDLADPDIQNHRESNHGAPCSPKIRKPRTTQDFQTCFSSRINLLGLKEDTEFSNLSDVEKQVVMFSYSNDKVIKSRKTGANGELLRQNDMLSFDDFIESTDHLRYVSESEPNIDPIKYRQMEQAWQKYGVIVMEATPSTQVESSINDQKADQNGLSLWKRASRGRGNYQPELCPRLSDSDDDFISPAPSPTLQRRPSALWIFPNPTLPDLRSAEVNVSYERLNSSSTGLEESDGLYPPRMVRQDRPSARRVFSLTTKVLGNTESISDNDMPSQQSGKLHIDSIRNAQVSPNSNTSASGELSPSQSSPVTANQTEPTSALRDPTLKRRHSLRQLGTLYSNLQNKVTAAAPGTFLRHRASSADIRACFGNSSAGSSPKTSEDRWRKMAEPSSLDQPDAIQASSSFSECEEDDVLRVIEEEMCSGVLKKT